MSLIPAEQALLQIADGEVTKAVNILNGLLASGAPEKNAQLKDARDLLMIARHMIWREE